MSETLHEYRDKNNDLVRVRKSSSSDGKPTGHGTNHTPLNYGK